MEIKIEKNIPIPSKSPVRNGFVDIFRQMEVGDSFLIPRGNIERSNLAPLAKLAGIKVSARLVDDNNIRVWRVK